MMNILDNDVVIGSFIAGVFTLLGVMITVFFTWNTNRLALKRNEQTALKNNRIKTYEKLMLYMHCQILGQPFKNDDELFALMILFASTDMITLWNHVRNFYKNGKSGDKFNVYPIYAQIRKEIGNNNLYAAHESKSNWLMIK